MTEYTLTEKYISSEWRIAESVINYFEAHHQDGSFIQLWGPTAIVRLVSDAAHSIFDIFTYFKRTLCLEGIFPAECVCTWAQYVGIIPRAMKSSANTKTIITFLSFAN